MASLLREKCQERDMASLKRMMADTGVKANLLSDGWQNVSKVHLFGSQLSLFGEVVVFGVDRVGDRHDGLAIAEQMEQVLLRAKDRGVSVGAAITDDAGQCARARKILGPRWTDVVFVKCFAHDVNNLVKAVLNADTSFKTIAAKAASAVNCIHASSSKWLVRMEKIMQSVYADSWKFIPLCDTRWNSMQGCFASLLRVKTAVKVFHATYHQNNDYPAALMVLCDPLFWSKLEIAEQVIRPLSSASFRLQRDQNTLADVVWSFIKIRIGFSRALLDRDVLLACVEKRWRMCEQPIFLIALFLHPVLNDMAFKLIDAGKLSLQLLSDFIIYYYRRLIGEDYGYIREEIEAWKSGTMTMATGTQWSEKKRVFKFWLHVKGEGKASRSGIKSSRYCCQHRHVRETL
jgi:hypothetical protein